VSAEFLAKANSAALGELMAGEPQIAAKVLASVNAPVYGLKKPLESMGQAVTYLGMNTVRAICMQYMLDTSFKAASEDLKVFYETIWEASACASELCFKLAQLLELPDPGNLVTEVVLSYIGPLSTYSLLDKDSVMQLAACNALERVRREQEQLGLCASEIGALLMQSWNVPISLIQNVSDIDKVMVSPGSVPANARNARLALCYLCKCLGLTLAKGEPLDLRTFDPMRSDSLEHFYLPTYLQQSGVARLPEFLQFPEVIACAERMAARALLRNSHQRSGA
jgi:HD-like signal output (HDOD) protein